MSKLCIGLFSGSLDKLTAAGVVMSGAAADDMDVDVFILLQGARAFLKGNEHKIDNLAEAAHLKNEFIDSLEKLKVTPWYDAFKNAKEMTNVKVHICSLAGKLWGGEKLQDFNDLADDLCGIGEYLTAAEQADIHMFI